MTDTPMTPDRERTIRMRRTHCEADRFESENERPLHVWGPSQYPTREMCQRCTVMRWWAEEADADEAVLLAEVDRLRARVAELESATGTALAMHRKHPDSEHCQYDDMTWPCLTVTTLGDPSEAAEAAEGVAGLDAMRAQHPAPCRVPDSPDCTCPAEGAYQSRILPSRAATCTCGHSGADHHHANTKCWANLPRVRHPRTGVVGPVATCACAGFVAAL